MADLDCRIVAMLALALSLLSLSGVIFVRHHQHHGAPYYHTPEAFVTERECLSCDNDSSSSSPTDDGIESSTSDGDSSPNLIATPHQSNKTSGVPSYSSGSSDISEACLQCICAASTGCKPAKCSSGLVCGIYRISQSYWLEAGSPTLAGVTYNGKEDSDSEKEYLQCVNNPFCAARAVKAYIERYIRDCDGDGMIDCYDYAALHIQGPTGCKLEGLNSTVFGRLYRCLFDLML